MDVSSLTEFLNRLNPVWIAVGLTSATILVTSGIWIGRVNSDRKNFKDFMEEVRDKLDRIFERLPSTPQIIRATSPLRLTDFGETLAKELDTSTWVERLVPLVRDEVKDLPAYAIQEYCFNYTREYIGSDEETARLKEVAYNNGVTEDDLRQVLALGLRDRLLSLAGLDAPE